MTYLGISLVVILFKQISSYINNYGRVNLCSLANYTEKRNPYHSIDAYPGTEFAETEAS